MKYDKRIMRVLRIFIIYFMIIKMIDGKSNNFNQLVTYLNFISDEIGYTHRLLIKYTESDAINANNLELDSSLWKYSEVRKKETGYVNSENDSKISDPMNIYNYQFSKLLIDIDGKHKYNYVLWTIEEENPLNLICSIEPKTIQLIIRIKYFNKESEANTFYDNLNNSTSKLKFVNNEFTSLNGYKLNTPFSISSLSENSLVKFVQGNDQYLNSCSIDV